MVVWVGFLVVCALAGGGGEVAKEGRARALELLDRYAATQDKIQSSFINKVEHTLVTNGYAGGGQYQYHDTKKKMFSDLRTDGDRVSRRQYRWGEGWPTGPLSRAKAAYHSSLWDGKYSSSYND